MNIKRKKILAISGSTRKGSSNERILQAVALQFKAELKVEVYTQIDQLPHFNPDVKDDHTPTEVTEFRNKIANSDGVIICTPEYVFSLPGSLKNALEWTVSTLVFSFKPVAFIVASSSGEKAFESLHLIMKTLVQTDIPEELSLLIKGGQSKVDQSGSFKDERVKEDVLSLVNALIEVIEKRPVPPAQGLPA